MKQKSDRTPEQTHGSTATSSRVRRLEGEFCVLAKEDTEEIELVGSVPAEQVLNVRHSQSVQENDSRDGPKEPDQFEVQAPADISRGQFQGLMNIACSDVQFRGDVVGALMVPFRRQIDSCYTCTITNTYLRSNCQPTQSMGVISSPAVVIPSSWDWQ